jgi:DNA-binding NarL/FixJ family response regulator
MELLPREFEIFICLANGESIEQISDKLHLSQKNSSELSSINTKKIKCEFDTGCLPVRERAWTVE